MQVYDTDTNSIWTYNGGAWVLQQGSDNLGDHTATQDLDLGANKLVGNGGTDGIAVAADGKVGIGTANPQDLLHLYSPTSDARIYLTSQQNNKISEIVLQNGGAPIWSIGASGSSTNAYINKGMHFWNATKGFTMGITENGNVGIGTNSPDAMLDIRGATLGANVGDTSKILEAESAHSGGNNSKFTIFNRQYSSTFSNWAGANLRMQKTIDATPQGFIDFGIDGQNYDDGIGFGSGSTTHMVVKSSGNVGIGTSTPTVALEVAGHIQNTGHIASGAVSGGAAMTVNDGYGHANLTFNHVEGKPEQVGKSARIEVDTDNTNSAVPATMSFELGDAHTALVATPLNEVMTLKGDGKVGIGTTTPDASAALDVSSTTRGFLPPRMTTAQRDAIASPAVGLTVYNTDHETLNIWNGTSFMKLAIDHGEAIVLKASNPANLGSTTVQGTVFNTQTASYDFKTLIDAYLTDALTSDEYYYLMSNRAQFKIEIGLGDRRGGGLESRFAWVSLNNNGYTTQIRDYITGVLYSIRMTLVDDDFTVTSNHGGNANAYAAIRGIRITRL
jgi:hypothetical protein